MIVYEDKLLKKSSNQKLKVVLSTWSLHCFQTIHFICDRFDCKLWLQSFHNHARHHFQAFARCHLKSLCWLIRIWADALSWGRLHFICDRSGANFGCNRFRMIPDVISPTRPSCSGAQPQELVHWFSSQNLRLSSGIAFGSDFQMTGRGSNLDSNLNSAAWPTGCKGFICSEVQK